MISGALHLCCAYAARGRGQQELVKNTDRLPPRVGAHVGVALGHLASDVSHQLLDDLERNASHGGVAGVDVAQVGVTPISWIHFTGEP